MTFPYQYVFVLGADIEKKGEEYVLAQEDLGGPLFADWRLKACSNLLAQGLVERIVMVSWHDEKYPDIVRAEIMKRILVEKYGADASLVEAVQQSQDGTQGNVNQIERYIVENQIDPHRCAFLTNFYHVPRAMHFFAATGTMNIVPLVAESFVPEEMEAIKAAYASEAFSKRLETELGKMGRR